MKKRKLKKSVFLVAIMSLMLVVFFGAVIILGPKDNKIIEDINYVSSVIWSNDVPVVSETEEKVLIKPYTDENVKISKYYYDYTGNEDSQKKSIVLYEDTYMQNSGVDYTLNDTFDVVSIYDGIVTKVEDNELAGKTIEIKHENNVVSVYQGLSEILVKEGQQVGQNIIIGKSGVSKINKEIGNHLHFELYISGQVVNPLDYFNKKIKDL